MAYYKDMVFPCMDLISYGEQSIWLGLYFSDSLFPHFLTVLHKRCT